MSNDHITAARENVADALDRVEQADETSLRAFLAIICLMIAKVLLVEDEAGDE